MQTTTPKLTLSHVVSKKKENVIVIQHNITIKTKTDFNKTKSLLTQNEMKNVCSDEAKFGLVSHLLHLTPKNYVMYKFIFIF